MATAPRDVPERDPKDDADARAWADDMKQRAESGELVDDTPYLKQRLQELTRKLTKRRQ